jgi:acyl-coenzyme A thioesterase PaaI-like protein
MSQESKTHLKINPRLCGVPVTIMEGEASAKLVTVEEMVADDQGLVHGGFIFGLVDYAAMLAVNDPYVVLGEAQVRLSAPVRLGQEVIASVEDRIVMSGTMTAFALERHVLEP